MDSQMDKNEHFCHLFHLAFNQSPNSTKVIRIICVAYRQGTIREITIQKCFLTLLEKEIPPQRFSTFRSTRSDPMRTE